MKSQRNRKRVVAWLLMLALLASCAPQAAPLATTMTPPAAEQTPPAAPAYTPPDLSAVDVESVPPQVIDYRPLPEDQPAADAAVELVFDRAMDTQSVEKAFSMTDEDGQTLRGSFGWQGKEHLTFQPARPLRQGAYYRVVLQPAARSAAGVEMGNAFSFRFRTVASLAVSQTLPADGQVGVDVDSDITVFFNRPVAALGIAEEQEDLPQPLTFDPPLEGTGRWVSTSVYVFQPQKPLTSATTYRASVAAGLKDSSGEADMAMAEAYTWRFTTLPPALYSFVVDEKEYDVYDPGQGAGVSLSPKIKIVFTQAMERASTQRALQITDSGGRLLPFRAVWSADSRVLTVTLQQMLSLDSPYTLQLSTDAQAADGGALASALQWEFRTVTAPAVVSTSPADGDENADMFVFSIQFKTPMRVNTIPARVRFSPSLPGRPGGQPDWYYDESNNSATFYGLKPSTQYTVEILPGMQDAYGNLLREGKTVRFSTAAAHPSAYLNMLYQPIYRTSAEQAFYVSYTNVESLDFKIYRVNPADLAKFVPDEDRNYTKEMLVADFRYTTKGRRDEGSLDKVEIRTLNGEPLPPGAYFLTLDSQDIEHDSQYLDSRYFVITDIFLAFKNSPGDALVWATEAASGKPLAGLKLELYGLSGNEKWVGLGSGATDKDGLLHLNVDPGYETRYAVSAEGEAFTFAQSNWNEEVSPYAFGYTDTFYAGEGFNTLAYIYTDRPIYRPGQTVYFKGIVRRDDDLNYLLPDLKEVEVLIYDYDKQVSQQVLPLSASGTFDGSFTLAEEAALGTYSVWVRQPGEDDRNYGGVEFNVAEYRKPEFQVDLSADPTNLLLGEAFTARVEASYYSGGALDQASVSWVLRARPFVYTPPEAYSGYSFSSAALDDDWRAYRYEYEGQKEISKGRLVTDEKGVAVFKVPVEIPTTSASQQLTLEANITDFSGNLVSSRVDVTAHRAALYGGIRPSKYVGKEGEEQTFEVVVLDWDGDPVANQTVSVAISERQWYSVQKQDAQGVLRWETNVKDVPAGTFDQVTDAEGKAAVRFTPSKGGIYRAVVTVTDAQGRVNKSAAYLWVAGAGYIPWRQSSDRTFQLVSDRSSYQPGMNAEILIASPFQGEAYALVTVERGKVRQKEVLLLTSNSTIYHLPIGEDMAPAVYVSVTVVKGVDDTNPLPSFKTAITRINVSTEKKVLQMSLTPDRTQAAPGEKVTYAIRTLDADGKPVSAELSLALTDLAVLALSEPNSPPLETFFYGMRGLSVRTILSHSMNVDAYNAMLNEMVEGRAMGDGGKESPYLGVVGVRQKFEDTAYWNALVQTDEQGKAEVTITLPDNLTTWRMDARAVTNDTLVGETTSDIISRKALMVRPQTPRFFVIGDQAQVAAAVHNDTGKALTITASLEAKGVELLDKADQEVVLQSGQQALVTWRVRVPPDSQRADLLFRAQGGGYADSSLPPLGTLEGQGIPIYRYQAPETVGTSGEVGAAETRSELIYLPRRYQVSSGNLRVQIEPSLAAGMESGLEYLETYAYQSVDVNVSRILPSAALLRALQTSGFEDKSLAEKLDRQVSASLQQLYNQQNYDGGWGWWSGMESDPLVSTYVLLGMAEMLDSGYTVDENALENGLGYLRDQMEQLEGDQGLSPLVRSNRQAFMLYTLARHGSYYFALIDRLYEQRLTLSLHARAFLAQAIHLLNPQDERSKTLVSELEAAATRSASGASWEEKDPDPWNWNTDTRTTAIVLHALVQIDPQSSMTVNGIRWLMHHRRNGCWLGTYETAWVLTTLANWLEVSGELKANYAYALSLNGKTLQEGQVNQQNLRDVRALRVDIADLLTDGANRLVFGRSDGEGRMYYSAFLTLDLPVDQIQPLDQGFSISRRYFRQSDPDKPINTAAAGEILEAELTIVVPNRLHYVMITDPLPAGLEAVDSTLKTSSQGSPYQSFDWGRFDREGWGWWYFRHVELRDEKVALFADWLPAGIYIYRYRVRAVTPGTYQVIPPTGQEVYFADVYARGAGSVFVVK